MFIVIPVSCMATTAMSSESGMLSAATSVDRRLKRKKKIVSTANTAPRAPSFSSPSRDSMMKSAWSDTISIERSTSLSATISSSASLTASDTSTVFADDVLLTESPSASDPLIRA